MPIADLVLDCINASLYWTTAHSVESARLNGRGHQTALRLGSYSGRYVHGLALDAVGGMLYWFVMQSEHRGLELYRARVGLGGGFRAEAVELTSRLTSRQV